MDMFTSIMNSEYLQIKGLENIASHYRANMFMRVFWSFSSYESITLSIGSVSCTLSGLSVSIHKYPDEEPVITVNTESIPTILMHIDGTETPVSNVSQKMMGLFVSSISSKRRDGYQVNMTMLPSDSLSPIMSYILSFLAMSTRKENRVFDIESLLVKLSRSKEKDRQFLESEITHKGVDKKKFTRFWTKEETASWQSIAHTAVSSGLSSIKEYIRRPQHGLDI